MFRIQDVTNLTLLLPWILFRRSQKSHLWATFQIWLFIKHLFY